MKGSVFGVSQLLFADDTIIFYGLEEDQASTFRGLFQSYEHASGQIVNFNKTAASFTKGVNLERRRCTATCLDIREALSHDEFLRLPSYIGDQRRNRFYPFLTILRSVLWVRWEGSALGLVGRHWLKQ